MGELTAKGLFTHETVTVALQALSLVEKAEPVQVRYFTQYVFLWVLSYVTNQLDLETLGFRPIMPNHLLEHCTQYDVRDPNNLPCTYEWKGLLFVGFL
jgi:hypothetical protein